MIKKEARTVKIVFLNIFIFSPLIGIIISQFLERKKKN
jgi:hypothetical protein